MIRSSRKRTQRLQGWGSRYGRAALSLVGDRSTSGRGGVSIKVIRGRTWDDRSPNAKACKVGFLRVVVRTVT